MNQYRIKVTTKHDDRKQYQPQMYEYKWNHLGPYWEWTDIGQYWTSVEHALDAINSYSKRPKDKKIEFLEVGFKNENPLLDIPLKESDILHWRPKVVPPKSPLEDEDEPIVQSRGISLPWQFWSFVIILILIAATIYSIENHD
jgi:hypothetical protein